MSALIISFRSGCFCSTFTVIKVLPFFFFSCFPQEKPLSKAVFLRESTNGWLGSRGERANILLYLHRIYFSVPDMRGFMTAHGQPDQPRSARYVLKDYVSVSASYIWVFLFSEVN